MQTMETRKARFWILWNNSLVRVTLAPGQKRNFGQHRQTDEGFEYRGMRLYHRGDAIHRCEVIDAKDCDGRSTEVMELECPLSDLGARIWDDGDAVLALPVWERTDHMIRDEAAERMNY